MKNVNPIGVIDPLAQKPTTLHRAAYGVVNTPIPTIEEAVRIIGGANRLAKLRTETVRLSTEKVGLKIQLALHITRKYLAIEGKQDLGRSVRQLFGIPYQGEQLVYELNKHDGPWAIAVSGGSLTWMFVTNDDVAALATGEDFLAMVFHHLR